MTQINNYSLGLHERLGKEKYLYNIFSEVEDSYHESIIQLTQFVRPQSVIIFSQTRGSFYAKSYHLLL